MGTGVRKTMKLLNRSALVLRPCAGFADWVAQVAPDEAPGLAALREEGRVYLIDEVGSDDDIEQALQQGWRAMFENELSVWDEFGDDWPQPLNADLFVRWFEVEAQVLAFDLSAEPLLRASLDQ